MTHSPTSSRDDAFERTRVARIGRIVLRMLAAVAMVGGSLAIVGVADSTAAMAADGVCDGVTVVVDFTDIGGELEVACAEDTVETGRDALIAAGFTPTDSQPGFLCAINSMPDPCPETFDGNFWSYWHSTPDGEWTSYQVGADSSAPARGDIEGWRYNDGMTPPGIAPADAPGAAHVSTPEATETPEAANPDSDQVDSAPTLADQQSNQTMVLTVVAVGFLALVVALIVFFVVRQRQHQRRNGTDSRTPGSRN